MKGDGRRMARRGMASGSLGTSSKSGPQSPPGGQLSVAAACSGAVTGERSTLGPRYGFGAAAGPRAGPVAAGMLPVEPTPYGSTGRPEPGSTTRDGPVPAELASGASRGRPDAGSTTAGAGGAASGPGPGAWVSDS